MNTKTLSLGLLIAASSSMAFAGAPTPIKTAPVNPKIDYDCQDEMKAIMVLASGYSANALSDPNSYGNPENEVKIENLVVTDVITNGAGRIEGTQTADVSSTLTTIKGKMVIQATRGGCNVVSIDLK